jgi:sigma-E factor negative regulatory protein RseA
MDTDKKLREHISALADGELPDSERELAFAALDTPAGRAAWLAYQLTGDALRGAPPPALSDGFGARLAARLAAEPAHAPAEGADAALEVQPAAIIFP